MTAKTLISVGGAGLAMLALLTAPGRAADHHERPALTAPMADISDVYAWMAGSNLNLVMTVSGRDDGSRTFGPSVQYVFHLTSKSGLGIRVAGGTETKVICQFQSNTQVECWVTDAAGTAIKDYVSGDPSAPAGLSATSRKLKVFAGRRSNPAFFHSGGLVQAIQAMSTDQAPRDSAGCANTSPVLAGTIRAALSSSPTDDFANSNVMALVVQIDRGLVNTGTNTTVAVWGSTHVGQ